MKKEDMEDIAQLLNAMKDAVKKIEVAQKEKDDEQLSAAKREILSFQKKLSEIL